MVVPRGGGVRRCDGAEAVGCATTGDRRFPATPTTASVMCATLWRGARSAVGHAVSSDGAAGILHSLRKICRVIRRLRVSMTRESVVTMVARWGLPQKLGPLRDGEHLKSVLVSRGKGGQCEQARLGDGDEVTAAPEGFSPAQSLEFVGGRQTLRNTGSCEGPRGACERQGRRAASSLAA